MSEFNVQRSKLVSTHDLETCFSVCQVYIYQGYTLPVHGNTKVTEVGGGQLYFLYFAANEIGEASAVKKRQRIS